MKKTILAASLLLFTALLSHSQINKGSVLLGGGIYINTTKIKDNNSDKHSNYISFSPAVGIAVKKNLIIGIELTYGHRNDSIYYSPQLRYNSYGGSVFLRKYLILGKGFYLFGESDLSFISDKYNHSQNGSFANSQKDWFIGAAFSPGISYAVTKKFHLEAALGQLISVGYQKTKIEGASSTGSFALNASANSLSNFNIGFRFFLSK